MSPGQPAGTVQDSKAKRQERLKSRFRDRGGIFVPAEGNALAQILLERGVNGESPLKRRSPRKSTAARTTTPKSVRSTKAASTTKTPRTASKRARKSTVVPCTDEPKIAPVTTTKKNKRPSTSKSKTPKSQGQRGRPHKKGVEVDGDGDVPAAPSCPHPAMRPKSFADRLADALNSTSAMDHFPPDPSRLTPSVSSLQVTKEGRRAALRGPRGDNYDDSDHSDLPLTQKLAPGDTRSQRGKKTGTKPAARRKRTATKAKGYAKRTADADGEEPTKHTANNKSAAAGRKPSANSRKREHEEMALRDDEDVPVPDVALPPTKRVRVLQEKKNEPRKRKDRTKNVDDGGAANNENENGPPAKKRRADPAASRRRRGKENENGMEPARKASKRAADKPLLSPTGTRRKTATSKGKPPSRSAGTQVRSRGLPPAVLRRIKVNAQTLEALQDIDDDDPIDFLRS